MAVLVHDCPHCRASHMSQTVVSYAPLPRQGLARVAVFTICPRCYSPTSYILDETQHSASLSWWNKDLLSKNIDVLEESGFHLFQMFPESVGGHAPAGCSTAIERVYLQARSALDRKDADAAALAYRRVMELACQKIDPNGNGTLGKRISAIAKAGAFPPAMIDWLNEVRLIGNEAAHGDDEAPPIGEIEAADEFVTAFLTYAFTLPAMVDARKSKRVQ